MAGDLVAEDPRVVDDGLELDREILEIADGRVEVVVQGGVMEEQAQRALVVIGRLGEAVRLAHQLVEMAGRLINAVQRGGTLLAQGHREGVEVLRAAVRRGRWRRSSG